MAETSWQLRGDYFETCSCDYLCACIYTNLAAQPTKGACTVALVFHIEQGRFGQVVLDDLNFVVAARAPGVMSEGNWAVGLLLDARATPEQHQALTAIASGQAGGPMAALAPLIGQFLGAESHPIHYQQLGIMGTLRPSCGKAEWTPGHVEDGRSARSMRSGRREEGPWLGSGSVESVG